MRRIYRLSERRHAAGLDCPRGPRHRRQRAHGSKPCSPSGASVSAFCLLLVPLRPAFLPSAFFLLRSQRPPRKYHEIVVDIPRPFWFPLAELKKRPFRVATVARGCARNMPVGQTIFYGSFTTPRDGSLTCCLVARFCRALSSKERRHSCRLAASLITQSRQECRRSDRPVVATPVESRHRPLTAFNLRSLTPIYNNQ
jgi:hypothetical protein